MIRKTLLPALLAFLVTTVIISAVTVFTPVIAQTNSTTTIYMDPPTINGTAIGVNNNITVTINIRDATDIYDWQAGLTFNPDILKCTNFTEGEFLSDIGNTFWYEGTINNTEGVITPYASTFLGDYKASGNGRLAYVNFTVIAPGFSDLHLFTVIVEDFNGNLVPANIIDVYTVIVDTTPHTVVTVHNSTDQDALYDSGLYDHAFNSTLKEVSFKVTGPHPGFSHVTIPRMVLMPPDPPRVWAVILDGVPVSRTVTENATHTSIYFTYAAGIHEVHITTRFMPSTISITLSEDSIPLGESVTISGNITAADGSVRNNTTVTIHNRTEGEEKWGTLATVETDSDGIYSHDWTPETTGKYELKASWEGDENTLSNESDIRTLTVKGAAGFPIEIVAAAVVAIIVIIAIVVYFAKIRKPKETE